MERIENSLLLNEDKMEDIHKSTLRILEKIGIQVPNQDVLQILQKEGARVDFQTQTANPGCVDDMDRLTRFERFIRSK